MPLLADLTAKQEKFIGYSTQELSSDVNLGELLQTLIDKINELEGRIETLEGA